MKKVLGSVFPFVISIVFVGWILTWLFGLKSHANGGEILSDSQSNIHHVLAENGVEETPKFMVGGVQMNEGNQVNWIKNLISSGMNTVEVTVYCHQGRWFDNNLWFGEVENSYLEEIRLAKRAGLNVVLILRLQLDHSFPENKFLWHGMVYPANEYFLVRWFENYTRFVRQWAKVAEEEGVDVLVLGSEMNALFSSQFVQKIPDLESYYMNPRKQKEYREKVVALGKDKLTSEYLTVYGEPNYTDLGAYLADRSVCNSNWAKVTTFEDSTDRVLAINIRRTIQNYYWEKLIWNIRHFYHGKMTVAANFDNYREIKFWKELDMIGINAYFPLRKISDDSLSMEERFEESWDEILADIEHFKDTLGVPDHPVLFTELGYSSYKGSSLAPWQGEGFTLFEGGRKDSLVIWDQQPQDVTERNRATRALLKAVKKRNFSLAGILYWKFTSWKYQEKEDPFALHIGPSSTDTLQEILADFK